MEGSTVFLEFWFQDQLTCFILVHLISCRELINGPFVGASYDASPKNDTFCSSAKIYNLVSLPIQPEETPLKALDSGDLEEPLTEFGARGFADPI
ncbi:hypothetical protein PanWU01x14_060020 [Parasponia andersonii]|uniref:Uncharacterized protein n=1 Tax=Parasponia andersonii TaxID=3476 RepID=A0A2P5DIP3_PARAD|nr:hypothetical protein PanWU01x14_060020 [Parasponia andersonii]